MADANAPKKRWWEWILGDVAISGIIAGILNYTLKTFSPKALDKLSKLLGEHVTKRYIEDKRAEILNDLRKMETSKPPRETKKTLGSPYKSDSGPSRRSVHHSAL